MVQNNKVLTVSYGTFSCTLEGFEDSFDTMKAIAEYFRDLASDDRYFGAEPPQPDADMLARIAQREVARQVEARTSSTGIHLRTSAPVPTAPLVAQAAQVQAQEPETAEPQQPPVQEVTQPAEADELDLSSVDLFEAAANPAEDAPEAVTQQDMAKAAPEAAAAEEAEAPEPAAEAPVEPQAQPEHEPEIPVAPQAEQLAEDLAEQEAAPEPDITPAASVDMATIAAISAAVSAEPAATAPVEDLAQDMGNDKATASDTAEEPAPAADSIAAKLQRIRAVVAKSSDSQPAADEFSEDEHAETFLDTVHAELAQTDDAESADLISDEGEDEAEGDEISRILDRLDLTGSLAAAAPADHTDKPEVETVADVKSAVQEQPAETQQDDATPEAQAESLRRPKRGIRLNLRQQQHLEQTEAEAAETGQPEPASTDSPAPQTEAAAEPIPTPSPAPTTDASKPQRRARIVKVKRAELETAMAAGNLEEITEEDDADNQAVSAESQVNSSLDPEEEADLMRELAEVEADLLASSQTSAEAAAPQPRETPAQEEPAEQANHVEVTELRPSNTPSPDSDVSRLMAAAESKLGDPDNATSRETYSHLRAAVAVSEADRSAGDNSAQADEAEPYRADLANVVRPRRPETNAARTPRARSKGSRPAPLKLVAEQRIDPVAKGPVDPVRPRRISAPKEEPLPVQAAAFGSFADYVQERGAAELHELLEAAAAYLSFVEGRDYFSRPQLMNKVRSVGHADFNRENGLRFFGQMLREGKIQRAATNGQFSVTDDIGFRPAKRAAG
ncbi:chemotaxis protein CheA [Pseudophaeobacter flagellatus]|uniref:chemotaxis protein CheA n=1 Tax=Pseudophaeobacter flagellatus TaxID=2899119 RepID=UPI001E4580B7|nr:chemotaxis protein CheA [Pseudophaeobacter flagellatus]MCD9149454.1 chemotaxis protein CheA [Pseudophaeobacter flagellatus]